MPKIRQVKPELFTSESVAALSMGARWLFVGLLTEADDEGRLLDLPKRIAGSVFPHDDVDGRDVEHWVDELEQQGQVLRYTAEGKRCLLVVNFRKHQYIPRPVKSRLPAPPDDTPPDQGTCDSHVATCGSEAVDMSGSSSSGVVDLGSSSSPDPQGETPAWALAEVERRYRATSGKITNPRAWRRKVLEDVLADGPPAPTPIRSPPSRPKAEQEPGVTGEAVLPYSQTARAALRRNPGGNAI